MSQAENRRETAGGCLPMYGNWPISVDVSDKVGRSDISDDGGVTIGNDAAEQYAGQADCN